MKKYAAEFIGTFSLVFFGTGVIALGDVSGMAALIVPMVFGTVVTVMILAFGDESGAHFNPAVSAGFFFSGRLSLSRFGLYAMSQTLGALAASACVKLF
ncbi:MAG: aquaporin, partial [Spirochaetia bacterium]|nr:aquaporin [Spirochaetia bacterium]